MTEMNPDQFARESSGALTAHWRRAQFEKAAKLTARVPFAIGANGRPRFMEYTELAALGASLKGEVAFVAGKWYGCTASGTPGTWVVLGSQS